ncbi:MAG: TonB-dependent receptor plug domain-containing protein [Methylomonas sp.]|nr:TonB-dependent receptor plug domain-containing protein [Methylomonas sp.]
MKLSTLGFMAIVMINPAAGYAENEHMFEEDYLAQIYGDKATVSIATGIEQPVHKAPAVASVITAADIKAMGATDIDEVLESVPGLHVATSYLGYAPIYTFRGVYSRFNPQVLMLINGIPITASYTGDRNLSWGGMPVQAISRIEVVRGPGSAVYGADAFAGVINIITKTKEDIDGTEIGGRVGSFDTYDGWALYGGEWKGFDVAATVEYHSTNGQNSIIDADAQSQFDRSFGTSASLAPGPVSLSRDNLDARLDLSREHWRFRGGLQHRDNYGSGAGVVQALDPVTMEGSDRWNADLTYHNAEFAEDWDVTAFVSYLDGDQHNTGAFPPGTRLPIGVNGLIDFDNPVQNRHVCQRFQRYSGKLGTSCARQSFGGIPGLFGAFPALRGRFQLRQRLPGAGKEEFRSRSCHRYPDSLSAGNAHGGCLEHILGLSTDGGS